MSTLSAFDEHFLETLQRWIGEQREILALIRYPRAGGSKSFEFFSDFKAVLERLRQLPPQTSIIAFKTAQLPLRGTVDDRFISSCLEEIPDGAEFLAVETTRRTAEKESWFHDSAGVSHTELRDALEDSRGKLVAVGLYPPWLEESANVVSAIVPDEHGVVKVGPY